MNSRSMDDEERRVGSETLPLLGNVPSSSNKSSVNIGTSSSVTDSSNRSMIGGLLIVSSMVLVIFLGVRTTTSDQAFQYGNPGMALSTDSGSSKSKTSKNQPNIIFILSDDQGYNSIDTTVSPFLYKLQKEGVKMTNYYTQELCAPARAALMTGRYPLTLGLADDELGADKMEGLSLSETFFPSLFQDAGYTTYMFGKWNLGNPTPQYLPTARGFDYFLGYLDAYNSYWSKMNPDKKNFRDFLFADRDCFYKYDGVDMDHYSTHLYQDKAIATIHAHDFDQSPMFMYLSFQAVHVPFGDIHGSYPAGIPDSYVDSEVLKYISKRDGVNQQQYLKALTIMDVAVANVYHALDKTKQLDNTYIVFASDNGGCPGNGGRNTPLRGTKGTLFEGGVHVEAFVSSPLIPSKQAGEYGNIFHVSDWFPTLLEFAGIEYKGERIDGVSHAAAILAGKSAPRETLLINYYYNPAEIQKSETYLTGRPMAIRNERYKLMHTYESKQATWWKDSGVEENDDVMTVSNGCSITAGMSDGAFTYYLFDLVNDPNETENLYDTSDKYIKIQEELYAAVEAATANAAEAPSVKQTREQYVYWKAQDNYIVPWQDPESGYDNYPRLCGMYSAMKLKPTFMSNWKEIYTRGSDEQQDTATDRMKDVGQSTEGGSGNHDSGNWAKTSKAALAAPAVSVVLSEESGADGETIVTATSAVSGAQKMPKPGKTPANMDEGDPNAGTLTSGGVDIRQVDAAVVAAEEAEASAEAAAAAAAAMAAAAAAAKLPPATHTVHRARE